MCGHLVGFPSELVQVLFKLGVWVFGALIIIYVILLSPILHILIIQGTGMQHAKYKNDQY